MTKKSIKQLLDTIRSYQPDHYQISGKHIIPDTEQSRLICAPPQSNLRVIAGAGTGKTTAIACRIKYLLDHHTTPDRLLVLTFNVDAKNNLIHTIDQIMGFPIKMEIRTIDSFCAKLCNSNNEHDTMDTADTVDTVDTVDTMDAMEIDKTASTSVARSYKEYGVCARRICAEYGGAIASQYRYVFFDEFQDVDEDQFHILKSLATNGCTLTVIGDDMQNIYQFRGSDNYWIINFDQQIANVSTYLITTNYRSTPCIVGLANHTVQYNRTRLDKKMVARSSQSTPIDLQLYGTRHDKYIAIIKQITVYQSQGIGYRDIAVIARNALELKLIEAEMEKAHIPYCARIRDKYTKDYDRTVANQMDQITLTTIHSAKGLEWMVVFMVDLCDKNFPSHTNNGLVNIEEERRLFYVAVTRAKKHLHFCASDNDIPLSRFLDEVHDHFVVQKYYKKTIPKGLYGYHDTNMSIKQYEVTCQIAKLSGRQLDWMGKQKYIPRIRCKTTNMFDTQIRFIDEIREKQYEADYALYCDLYMTRELMIKNGQQLADRSCELILNHINLTEPQRTLVKKYGLGVSDKQIVSTRQIEPIDMVAMEQLIGTIQSRVSLIWSDRDTMQFLQNIETNSYIPRTFIDRMRQSYRQYQDPTIPSAQMLDALYVVSLGRRIHDKRMRLIYRDIRRLYVANNIEAMGRMDMYLQMIRGSTQQCKIGVGKIYEGYVLGGEIDLIDVTGHTIVDIKCSEQEMSKEWLVQLLVYYALYMDNPTHCYEIRKLAIINVFSGKYYEFVVPKNYDHRGLLAYMGSLIEQEIEGSRVDMVHVDPQHVDPQQVETVHGTVDSPIGSNATNPINPINPIDVVTMCKDKTMYMVLDIENNVSNNDIIQIAYQIHTHADDTVVKQANRYVANRYIDQRTTDLTHITNPMLRDQGVEFEQIIREFIGDLQHVDMIAGHHIHTDMKKIFDNMDKYMIRLSGRVFDQIVMLGTETMFQKIHRTKSGTLGHMYKGLFGHELLDAHNAMADVMGTARCYARMRRELEHAHGIAPRTLGRQIEWFGDNAVGSIGSSRLCGSSGSSGSSITDVSMAQMDMLAQSIVFGVFDSIRPSNTRASKKAKKKDLVMANKTSHGAKA